MCDIRSWADTRSCKYFVDVLTGKDIPGNDDLHETSGEITLDEIHEKNFLGQFNVF